MCLPFFHIFHKQNLTFFSRANILESDLCIFIGVMYIYLHCYVVKLTLEVIAYEESHFSISYYFSS